MGIAEIIGSKREEILRIAAKHGVTSIRVFGSVARGEAGPESDVDFLVEAGAEVTPWFPGKETFLADMRTQAAVIRKLHELSESVKRLHLVVGDRSPDLPWREVIAFRDVIVHDSLGLNLERVGDIATIHLPALKPHIEKIAADLAI